VTEDLRALLRAELNDERPPPLGDVVGAALRAGLRIRRRRRSAAAAVAAFGVVAFLLAGGLAVRSEPRPGGFVAENADEIQVPVPARSEAVPGRAAQKAPVSPGSVPFRSSAPTAVAPERTLAIHSGTHVATGPRKKATTGAMLRLLTQLLPAGQTSAAAVADGGDLHVQLYLDRGAGPGMVRLSLAQAATEGPRPARGGTARVTISHPGGDCVRDTVVVSRWPDGTTVRADVASCLVRDGRTTPSGRPPITVGEAVKLTSDPRWALTMDASLVDAGAEEFGRVPVFTA